VNGLEERLAAIVGATPVAWAPRAGGYSTAERYTVDLDDGRRVFVKAADAEHLAGWLRREHEVYSSLDGSFIPALLGFDDDGVRPLLVLEDLSHADWGTSWTDERVSLVRTALDELSRAAPPPSNTYPVRETFASLFAGWQTVAEDPEPFLSVGLRSREWLAARLPALMEAVDAMPDGDALIHLDVRSDNLCTLGARAVLVDWNWLSIGPAAFDLAGWACSLHLEGGPPPWELVPHAPEFASFLAGAWAEVVGLPPPETAPTVREFQARQLAVALDWVDRELG
jgi:phosphotransferase family enzyme